MKVTFSLKYSIPLREITLSTIDMSFYNNYIMINYILLHVSTFNKSTSGHLNLLLLTNS
jgi:hypothetical protein